MQVPVPGNHHPQPRGNRPTGLPHLNQSIAVDDPDVPEDAALRDVSDSRPSSDRPKEDDAGLTTGFPILTREWRMCEPHPLAFAYFEVVNCDFPIPNSQLVIKAGADLMLEVGSFTAAARHVREIQIRRQHDARVYIESRRRHFPAVDEEVGGISRIGVCPPFEHARSTWHETGPPP